MNLLHWLKYWPGPHQRIDNQYLDRWWIIPRNRWFNIYLHRFTGGDSSRDPHDHPWNFVTLHLKGAYQESVFRNPIGPQWETIEKIVRLPWTISRRHFSHTHVVTNLVNCKECWTLVITGRKCHNWGFYKLRGIEIQYIPWREYINHRSNEDFYNDGT